MLTDTDYVAFNATNAKDVAIPQFFIKQVKNNFKTRETGHPVYDEKEYVRIIIPGDRNSIPERPVKDEDKGRWPRQYNAFKEGLVLAPEGLPLEKWPLIDINQIEHLKHWNVRTVEQLSQINDQHIQKMGMGMRDLKNRAIAYLDEAKHGSGITKIAAERDELKHQVTSQQDQIAALTARLDDLARKQDGAQAGPAPAVAATGLTQADIARMIAEGIAAAQPPKNKGGRPKKPTPEHELPSEGDED